MKFLEAKARLATAHKMAPGVRADQREQAAPPEIPVAPLPTAAHEDVQALADEVGVDLHGLIGSGRNGRILMGDVRRAAAERDAAAEAPATDSNAE